MWLLAACAATLGAPPFPPTLVLRSIFVGNRDRSGRCWWRWGLGIVAGSRAGVGLGQHLRSSRRRRYFVLRSRDPDDHACEFQPSLTIRTAALSAVSLCLYWCDYRTGRVRTTGRSRHDPCRYGGAMLDAQLSPPRATLQR